MDSLYCELLIFLKFTGQNKWQSQRNWVVPFWVSTVIFALPNFPLPACLPYNPSLLINLHLHFNHAHWYLRPHLHWRCTATDLNNRLLVANIRLLLSFGRLVMVHSKGSGTFEYLGCHGVLQLLFGMHNRSRKSSIWLGKNAWVTCVCARESLSGLTWLLSCSTRYRNLQLPYHNRPRKRSEWESPLHGFANLAMYLSPLDRIIAAVVVDVYWKWTTIALGLITVLGTTTMATFCDLFSMSTWQRSMF